MREIAPEKQKNNITKAIECRGEPIFFFRGQIFELLSNVKEIETTEKDKAKSIARSETREIIFKSLLLSSDLWSQRVQKVLKKENIEYFRNASAIRESVEYTNPAQEFYLYLGKLIVLYKEIFPLVYENIEEQFNTDVGFSIDDYILCCTYLIVLQNHNKEASRGFFSKKMLNEIPANRDLIINFMNHYAVKLPNIYDVEELPYFFLKHPIIECFEGYQIGDYITFLKFIIDGPIFTLQGSRNTWLTKYGEVIEKYVFDLFDRIYPQSDFLVKRFFKGLTYHLSGVNYEIDISIINPESIILAEIKQSFLNKDAINVDDPDKYLDALDSKYGIHYEYDRRKVKGVGQLHRHILNYINNDISELPKKNKIYPLLIVNDSQISTALTNNYLNKEFMNLFKDVEILPDRSINLKDFRVFPLIVLSIKELEMMERSIICFGLENILKKYCEFNISGNETIYDFMASKEDMGFYNNTFLAGKGAEYLDKMCLIFFPNFKRKIMENKKNRVSG